MAVRHEAYREKQGHQSQQLALGHSARDFDEPLLFDDARDFEEAFSELPDIDDSDVEDEYTDANDELLEYSTDLESSLRDCELAMQKFFNNEFQEARAILVKWSKTSIYSALGIAIFEVIPAILTLEPDQIKVASVALKRTVNLCHKHRRNYGFVNSLLSRRDYSVYTDMEAHAELVHGEALLLQALLYFIEDEEFKALIKATLAIKSCYTSYRASNKIMNSNKKWASQYCKQHFESGVKMGIGAFNLLISLLPGKIISLLEFVGFQGSKREGLNLLETGSASAGLRQQLCQLIILGYHLVVCVFTGRIGDLDTSRVIIESQLSIYPKGVWFLLFQGRLDFMSGRYDEALRGYEVAIRSQDEWKQVHHLCYWDIMWLKCMKREWLVASDYSGRLLAESTWCRTIYAYLHAALLLQKGRLTQAERAVCEEHMRIAPSYLQRFAGKSLPMEKFVTKRCSRFFAQRCHLVLPGLEMLCLWNVFETFSCNPEGSHEFLEITQETIEDFSGHRFDWEGEYEIDNRALIYFIHGCLLRHVEEYKLSMRALNRVLRYKNAIKEDHFLVPYAMVELGLCMFSDGDAAMGIELLNNASKYKGYSLESRLQFRIHTKLQEENEKKDLEGRRRRK